MSPFLLLFFAFSLLFMDWNSSSSNLIYFEQGMAHIEHDTLLPLFLRFPRQFREYNSILSMRFLWTNAPIQIFVSSSAKAIRRSDKNASFAMTEKLDTHLAYYSIMVVFNYGTHVPSPKKKTTKSATNGRALSSMLLINEICRLLWVTSRCFFYSIFPKHLS